jgi:hypothetical protein
VENHAYAVALHFVFHNFVRVHQTLRVTPAMAAGLADHAWRIEDIVSLVEAAEPKPAKRGPYKPRMAAYFKLTHYPFIGDYVSCKPDPLVPY